MKSYCCYVLGSCRTAWLPWYKGEYLFHCWLFCEFCIRSFTILHNLMFKFACSQHAVSECLMSSEWYCGLWFQGDRGYLGEKGEVVRATFTVIYFENRITTVCRSSADILCGRLLVLWRLNWKLARHAGGNIYTNFVCYVFRVKRLYGTDRRTNSLINRRTGKMHAVAY